MKKPARGARGTPTAPIPLRHQFESAVPTVIHHPEEKMTALARLTQRLLREPRKYLSWVLGVLVVVLGAVAISNYSTVVRSGSSAIWEKLDTAKTADDRISLAKEYPGSPAANWALLQAAGEFYNQGLADLPNNRDVAGPLFKKAIALYDQVTREAPKDSFPARVAALGKARALEASYDLPKAIEQYKLVAQNWPGTADAAEATELAQALEKPEAAAFYKELYSYTPTKFTLPPSGTTTIPSFPGLPDTDLRPSPLLPLETSPSAGAASKDLPAEVFAKPLDITTAPAKAAGTKPAAPAKAPH
jgi:hypothetical protein